MKKKGLLITIIVLIVLLILAGGAFAYIYLGTDLLKSDKELFTKYAMQMGEQENGFVPNILTNYEDKKKTTKYSNNGDFSVNTEIFEDTSTDTSLQGISSMMEYGNNTNITFSGRVDSVNSKVEQDISINYSDTVNFPFKYKQVGDVYALEADNIATGYIAVENNNLPELLQKFGVTDVTGVPNKIEVQELQSLQFTEEEKTHIYQNYLLPLFNELAEDKFSKVENADGSVSYVLSTTNVELQNYAIQMLEILRNDTTMINKINNIVAELYQENYDETMNITAEDIDEIINDLSEQNLKETIVQISITQKDGMTNNFAINIEEITINLNKQQTDSNLAYNISITNNENATLELAMSYSGLNTESVAENLTFTMTNTETASMVYTYNNTVSFDSNINIEDFANDVTILNNYPAEQVQHFIEQLFTKVASVNQSQMQQIGFPMDTLNPMYMWIAGATLISYLDTLNTTIDRAEESQNYYEEDAQYTQESVTNMEVYLNEYLQQNPVE